MDVKPYKNPYPFKKLSKNLVKSIVKDINEGSPYKLAARANKVTERMVYYWIAQGIVDVEHEIDSLCALLVHDLAQGEMKDIKELRKMVLVDKKGHAGAQWTLERVYWMYYGQNAMAIQIDQKLDNLNFDNKDKQELKDAIKEIKKS